jgi:hypothetical protein
MMPIFPGSNKESRNQGKFLRSCVPYLFGETGDMCGQNAVLFLSPDENGSCLRHFFG